MDQWHSTIQVYEDPKKPVNIDASIESLKAWLVDRHGLTSDKFQLLLFLEGEYGSGKTTLAKRLHGPDVMIEPVGSHPRMDFFARTGKSFPEEHGPEKDAMRNEFIQFIRGQERVFGQHCYFMTWAPKIRATFSDEKHANATVIVPDMPIDMFSRRVSSRMREFARIITSQPLVITSLWLFKSGKICSLGAVHMENFPPAPLYWIYSDDPKAVEIRAELIRSAENIIRLATPPSTD